MWKNIHKTDTESHEIIEGSEIEAPRSQMQAGLWLVTAGALVENLCCTVVICKLVVICNHSVKLACRN